MYVYNRCERFFITVHINRDSVQTTDCANCFGVTSREIFSHRHHFCNFALAWVDGC